MCLTAAKSADTLNLCLYKLWRTQPGDIRSVLTGPLAHFDPFKSTHFLCHKSVLKQVLHITRDHVWCILYIGDCLPFLLSPAVQLLDRLFLHLLCFCFWPTEWIWPLNVLLVPLLPFPPSLLQSRHPHQHVSGAVWVSIYVTRNYTSSPDWNTFKQHLL